MIVNRSIEHDNDGKEQKFETIRFHANDSCGEVNWTRYNFVSGQFLVNYRLSDIIWIYFIPVEAYEKFREMEYLGSLKAEKKFMEEFRKEFKGEPI